MDPDLTETRARLERKDSELCAWMDEAMLNGEDCLYISMGSECTWLEWEAKAFADGVEKLDKMHREKNGRGVRCIVSFRTDKF